MHDICLEDIIAQYCPQGWYLSILLLGSALTNTIPRDSIDQYCTDAGPRGCTRKLTQNGGVILTVLNPLSDENGKFTHFDENVNVDLHVVFVEKNDKYQVG